MSDLLTSRTGDAISVEEERSILASINQWLDQEVRDQVLALEHADEYPHDMVAQMKALGLFGATIGQRYGGLGLPSSTYSKVVSMIAEVWM